MSKRQKAIYHILSVILLLGSVVMGVFVFQNALIRTIESGRDFGLSVVFYFAEIFGFEHNIVPTVTQLSSISWVEIMPVDFSGFIPFLSAFGKNFIAPENFSGYLAFLLGNSDIALNAILFGVLFLVVVILIVWVSSFQVTTKTGDTICLRAFKFLTGIIYYPIKSFVVVFATFLRRHRVYFYLLAFVWLINANLTTIALSPLAFVFYFSSSIDIAVLIVQLYKLFMDIAIFLAIPFPIWLTALWAIRNWRLRERGYRRLERRESKNKSYISQLPLAMLFVGPMGVKKTTTITDIALTKTVELRDKAFEIVLRNDLHFPFFPWYRLETALKKLIKNHRIYNLATIEEWLKRMEDKFLKSPARSRLFGYDYKRYGYYYNDGLSNNSIWETLTTYAKAYFIYSMETSLLISNYGIREDSILEDLGNFPKWNNDFFRRDSRRLEAFSRHSHILDFDLARMGERLVKENEKANFFEFGVLVITEVGKERGNQYTLGKDHKDANYATRSNDLFNLFLKMIRHSSTVDNYPFAFLVMDEQRPMSLGADARELCDVVHINSAGERECLLPGFVFPDWLHEVFSSKFTKKYTDRRYRRGDNSLSLHIIKTVISKIETYWERRINIFGSIPISLSQESGTLDGGSKKHTYYLSTKKIYSKRFATDAFSDFFKEKALLSPIGLLDVPVYQAVKAVYAELLSQNSYFVNDLNKVFAEVKKKLKAMTKEVKECQKDTSMNVKK